MSAIHKYFSYVFIIDPRFIMKTVIHDKKRSWINICMTSFPCLFFHFLSNNFLPFDHIVQETWGDFIMDK